MLLIICPHENGNEILRQVSARRLHEGLWRTLHVQTNKPATTVEISVIACTALSCFYALLRTPLQPSYQWTLSLVRHFSLQMLWRKRSKSCPHGLTFTWWGCRCLCLWHKPTELAHSLLFCSCGSFCLYDPFNCISFHIFSRQLSTSSLCSSGLISALLVLSTIYLFLKLSLSTDIILCGWLGL